MSLGSPEIFKARCPNPACNITAYFGAAAMSRRYGEHCPTCGSWVWFWGQLIYLDAGAACRN